MLCQIADCLCCECHVEAASELFSGLPVCPMCLAKLEAAYAKAASMPFPKWTDFWPDAAVQAHDLRHDLVPEVNL